MASLCILLDLPCSGEWHRFPMPTVMYTSLSADTIGQCGMHVVPNVTMFVICVNYYQ